MNAWMNFATEPLNPYEFEDLYQIFGENDVIIEPSFLWVSDIYTFSFFNNKPAVMAGKFLLKLNYIDINKTELIVKLISLEAKTFTLFKSLHGLIPISSNVDSTGIEEYIFINYIGCYMGLAMPEIKRPSDFVFLNYFCKKERKNQ